MRCLMVTGTVTCRAYMQWTRRRCSKIRIAKSNGSHCGLDGLEQVGDVPRVLHEDRSEVSLLHTVRWAANVNVNLVVSSILTHTRRLRHDLRVIATQLHSERPFRRVKVEDATQVRVVDATIGAARVALTTTVHRNRCNEGKRQRRTFFSDESYSQRSSP